MSLRLTCPKKKRVLLWFLLILVSSGIDSAYCIHDDQHNCGESLEFSIFNPDGLGRVGPQEIELPHSGSISNGDLHRALGYFGYGFLVTALRPLRRVLEIQTRSSDQTKPLWLSLAEAYKTGAIPQRGALQINSVNTPVYYEFSGSQHPGHLSLGIKPYLLSNILYYINVSLKKLDRLTIVRHQATQAIVPFPIDRLVPAPTSRSNIRGIFGNLFFRPYPARPANSQYTSEYSAEQASPFFGFRLILQGTQSPPVGAIPRELDHLLNSGRHAVALSHNGALFIDGTSNQTGRRNTLTIYSTAALIPLSQETPHQISLTLPPVITESDPKATTSLEHISFLPNDQGLLIVRTIHFNNPDSSTNPPTKSFIEVYDFDAFYAQSSAPHRQNSVLTNLNLKLRQRISFPSETQSTHNASSSSRRRTPVTLRAWSSPRENIFLAIVADSIREPSSSGLTLINNNTSTRFQRPSVRFFLENYKLVLFDKDGTTLSQTPLSEIYPHEMNESTRIMGTVSADESSIVLKIGVQEPRTYFFSRQAD